MRTTSSDYDSHNSQAIFDHYHKTRDAAARMAFEIYFLHQRIHELESLLNSAPEVLGHLTGMKIELDIEEDGDRLYEVLSDAAETTYRRTRQIFGGKGLVEVNTLTDKIFSLEDDIEVACRAIDQAYKNNPGIPRRKRETGRIELVKQLNN